MSSDSIGAKYRAERLRRRLSLEEISAQTRINAKHLESIEAGEFDKLPGAFFQKSFARQYAASLGMDWSEIEADLNEVLEPPAPLPFSVQELPTPKETARRPKLPSPTFRAVTPIKVPPLPVSPSKGPALAIRWIALSFLLFLTMMAGGSIAYSYWARFHRSAGSAKPVVHEPAEQPAPGPGPAANDSASPPATQPAPAAPVAESNDGARQTFQPSARSLSISATEDTWVSVSSEGGTIFRGILKANQTKVLKAPESAKLLAGNAGGLRIEWNGQAIGPVGPRGQVRILQLNPDSFAIYAPHKADKEGSKL